MKTYEKKRKSERETETDRQRERESERTDWCFNDDCSCRAKKK